jgi:ubiquinone/menaquinone biosynthesis C-methylase UbiE
VKRSHKLEKLARIFDDEILPIWSQRFGRMILRGLELPPKSMVLDVACGTGYPALELLRKMDEQSRLIAIDPASVMLDVARRKAGDLAGKRVFFRTETANPKLRFADGVYDLVVCNLGLGDLPDPKRALADFRRVAKPGGKVVVTLPLAGTFEEFFDIYREVLTKHDRHQTLERLERHVGLYPDPEHAAQWMQAAGLEDVHVEVEEFVLLFKSAREFFFAPVIDFGPLAKWKEIAGRGQELQDIFWFIKEAIDAYFGDRAFQVTVKAGCLRGTRPLTDPPAETVDDDATGKVPRTDPEALADDHTSSSIPIDSNDLELVDEAEAEEELDAFKDPDRD